MGYARHCFYQKGKRSYMSRQNICKTNGWLLGFTEERNGKKWACTPGGWTLGFYDSESNFTCDSNGSPICQGDVTAGLIYKNENGEN